ncbi:AmmeMemoRadiSam system protein B [Selenomonas sp. F0473]|uniref:AmmeMemoRadiSam system protein B n=1 Tax=Selenomonas sp. F0473 TaxID=999423 RepID=UPI00029DF822|nr:AmmeMemoRadiSam system protein B [Selenomonas sp. F0473]EKU71184.1 hypothetical protein HMPREF9161_01278 [Selenomonas sp. F0473]
MSIIAAYVVPHPPSILPEIGGGAEQKLMLTANAYERAMKEAAAAQPDTVIIASPHTVSYADYFHIAPGDAAMGDFAAFGASDIKVDAVYDEPFAKALEKAAGAAGLEAGPVGGRNAALDHGVTVPLHFLQAHRTDFRLVRVGLSGLSPLAHYRFGMCIAQTAEALGRKTVFIASANLSHRLSPDAPQGFAPEGARFDKACMKYLEEGDFLKLLRIDPALAKAAGECGLRALWMMAGALDARALKIKKLSYQGTTGIGYGVVSLRVTREDPRRAFAERYELMERHALAERRSAEDDAVRLARSTVEQVVTEGTLPPLPQDLSPEMTARAGVYVTIEADGALRGRAGAFEPTEASVAAEIVKSAADAALRDPSFPPVREEELPAFVYTVDVLAEPELAGSAADLDVKRYGIIVEYRARRGLVLPNQAGIATVEDQIKTARRCAGIPADVPVRIWRFTTERHC